MGTVITTDSLTKTYGKKDVVKDLDLRGPGGSIYGFLGPNGAGKSTTMKMILGLIKPSKGEITVLGKEVNEKNRLSVLRNTGSLIESPSYYGHLSGVENLEIICTLKNVPTSEIQRVLKIVRMEKQKDKKVSQYSLGMKQRLGLAAALLGNPKVLLLDEPTNGLDPAGIQEMRDLLSEIDQMATHVGIINQGELIFQDSLSALHKHSRSRLILTTDNDTAALSVLLSFGLSASFEGKNLCLKATDNATVIKAVNVLVQSGIGILRLNEQQMSLEDIFLQLIGKQVSL